MLQYHRMNITFTSAKLAKVFNSEKSLIREFGVEDAKRIKLRMAVLLAANCLADVPITPPTRRHELIGDRKEQFAVDLKHPRRLIFEPNHNPRPLKEDKGLDLGKITAITILGVEDYHG